MVHRMYGALTLIGAVLLGCLVWRPAQACCPAFPTGKPVVNADQTVILIWDPTTKTEHLIRRASFKSEADDFGFLVPTPNRPELDESGNEAFGYLLKLTEPEKKRVPRSSGGMGCGCGAVPRGALETAPPMVVRVLEEKRVAGFNATVLEATSATALVDWLKSNGYAFSPEVEAWAKPYVEADWKITALKVARGPDGKGDKHVAAAALRLSFKTDRPLFPYREPESTRSAVALGATQRLLRIYFISDARHEGTLTQEVPWTGHVAWAGKLKPEDRKQMLELLKLPETTGPAAWWLTEFEDNWPYKTAPADLYFARDVNQAPKRRPPVVDYVASPWPHDVTGYALAAVVILPPLFRRLRRERSA
jgi:hypothetical protein